jgi:hypothetical protein
MNTHKQFVAKRNLSELHDISNTVDTSSSPDKYIRTDKKESVY